MVEVMVLKPTRFLKWQSPTFHFAVCSHTNLFLLGFFCFILSFLFCLCFPWLLPRLIFQVCSPSGCSNFCISHLFSSFRLNELFFFNFIFCISHFFCRNKSCDICWFDLLKGLWLHRSSCWWGITILDLWFLNSCEGWDVVDPQIGCFPFWNLNTRSN